MKIQSVKRNGDFMDFFDRMIFKSDQFRFIAHYDEVGNGWLRETLRVESVDKAQEYGIDIIMDLRFTAKTGGNDKYDYCYIQSSTKIEQLTLTQQEEFAETLLEAVHFSKSIFEWLDNNPEYKA